MTVQLFCGDCLEIMPTLGRVDAVVTDPPYGINKDGQKESQGKHGGRKAYDFKGWDVQRPTKKVFEVILSISDSQIIWGGNYFADFLPATMGWLVWDKGQRINQSDGELAWTSRQKALRIKVLNRVEIMLDGAVHPTQKPLALMEWCLSFLPDAVTILDPFMGSGTTGVACVNLGRNFIGIEKDPQYFEIAKERIAEAERRKNNEFFVKKPTAPTLFDFMLEDKQ
jgi:site-specific DNA-methyltransferase (adenine-specific)